MVVVPFEPVLGEDLAAQKKQADKARSAQASSEAQAMLSVAPGRLGRLEKERGESSATGAGRLEEEERKGARPYVPNGRE